MKNKTRATRKSRTRLRALAVLSRMRRRDESLSKAARALRTAPRTVRKFVGWQLRRAKSGRYSATKNDRLKREITVFSYDGYVPVTARSSAKARLASEHLIAIGRYLRDGDASWLKRFVGKRIGDVELITDQKRIHEFADADEVKLDGLYRDQRGSGRRK